MKRHRIADAAFIVVSLFIAQDEVPASPDSPDVFDTIQMSPEQVVSSMSRTEPLHLRSNPMMTASPWVNIPMSDTHRTEFMKALRRSVPAFEPSDVQRWDAWLDLMDESQKYEEALEILSELNPPEIGGSNPKPRIWYGNQYLFARKVGFLIKTGQTKEAQRLVEKISMIPHYSFSWTAIITVDLALGRTQKAIETLEVLLRETRIGPASYALVARQQIDLALRTGKIDTMVAENVPPTLRAIRLKILGRSDEATATWRAALAQLSPMDVARLLKFFHSDKTPAPELITKTKEILRDVTVTPANKARLILHSSDWVTRLSLFFELKAGHEKVATLVKLETMKPKSISREQRTALSKFIPSCDKLLQTHRNNPWLHYLRSVLMAEENNSRRKHLEIAAQGGTGDSPIVMVALDQLLPQCTSEELDRIITRTPGYPGLSRAVKMERFRKAQLDHQIINIYDELDFKKPESDLMSGKIVSHLLMRSNTNEIPEAVVQRILRRLPELCLGSPQKSPKLIASNTSSWFRFFSIVKTPEGSLSEAAKEISQALNARKIVSEKGILSGIPVDVRKAAGIPASDKTEAIARDNRYRTIPEWLLALKMFSHQEVMNQNLRQRARFDRIPRMNPKLTSGVLVLTQSKWRNPAAASIFAAHSGKPGTDSISLAIKLRGILKADAPRARIFDLLVATSLVPCDNAEVKTLAAKHTATLAKMPLQQYPYLATFVYLTRSGVGDAGPSSTPSPPDLSILLPETRAKILGILSNLRSPSRRSPGIESKELKAILAKFAPKPAPTPPRPTVPAPKVSVYDQLKFLQANGRGKSPEAIAIARKSLDAMVAQQKPYLNSTGNVSISTLVKAKQFEPYLKQLLVRMRKNDRSELYIQRAFMHLHSYRIIHSAEVALPYATKVFELDPSDLAAAQLICEVAIKKRDPKKIAVSLSAIAAHSSLRFSYILNGKSLQLKTSTKPLSLIHGKEAADFLRQLMGKPLENPPSLSKQRNETRDSGLLTLLLFTLEEAPDQFEEVFKWSGISATKDENLIAQLASAMQKAGLTETAVKMLARRYFANHSDDAEALRFRVKQRHDDRLAYKYYPLRELAKSGLLQPLAKVAEATATNNANQYTLLSVRLAADPTVASWNRLIVPALASAPAAHRDSLHSRFSYIATSLNKSEDLQIFLTLEKIENGKEQLFLAHLHKPLQIIAASKNIDRKMVTSKIWKRIAERLEQDRPDPNQNSFLQRILPLMAAMASDEDWKSYLHHAQNSAKLPTYFASSSGLVLSREISIERIRDIAQMILTKADRTKAPSNFLISLLARLGQHETYDADVLAFRPWFAKTPSRADKAAQVSSMLRFIDLIASDKSAILPTLVAEANEEGNSHFHWSLTGGTSMPLARKFKQYDGKFDLTFMAGPDPKRLSRIARRPQAAATGSELFELPAGSRYAALMATDRDGQIVRWSETVEIGKNVGWKNVTIKQPRDLASIKMDVIPHGGPFADANAYRLSIKDGKEFVIADIPWSEGPIPTFSFWIIDEAMTNDIDSIMVKYLDRSGSELDSSRAAYRDSSNIIPQWRRVTTEKISAKLPGSTTRIQLICKPTEKQDSITVQLAKAMVSVPRPVPLPDGVERVSRVSANIDRIVFDSTSNRIILASDNGIGVFDIAKKQFANWISLVPDKHKQDIGCRWLQVVGKRVFHSDRAGKTRYLDLDSKKVILIGPKDIRKTPVIGRSTFAVSADGSFLAMNTGLAGFKIVQLNENGIVATRSIAAGNIRQIAFDEKQKNVSAYDGTNLWTIPLNDWKNAKPVATRGFLRENHEHNKFEWYRPIKVNDRILRFRKLEPTSRPSLKLGIENTLSLPSGHFLRVDDNTLWSISEHGSIYRIDLKKTASKHPENQ